ncbi:hypothetical protein FBALC1_05428 [Flavobacteriales bacterium ALC-1]|nr:hypothetical protein FBALC1_05428 [Flavobacteriales bacterium ALC-1]
MVFSIGNFEDFSGLLKLYASLMPIETIVLNMKLLLKCFL